MNNGLPPNNNTPAWFGLITGAGMRKAKKYSSKGSDGTPRPRPRDRTEKPMPAWMKPIDAFMARMSGVEVSSRMSDHRAERQRAYNIPRNGPITRKESK